MGIKGIYGEIGTGRRISLSKLAGEHIAAHGQPLRIAIDISIWLFQVQASAGGASPAIRTLYFRLVRLLGHGIRPLFVFDGPNKPPFKRGAPTSSAETSYTRPAKRLIGLFGFQHHTAPGEAEAECANLQRSGIVDMVLSEDVDTLAFGCTATLRNWTAEGARGSKAPTHVNLFTAPEIKQGCSGLDREGMILIALMNGGDYLPAGIPGCGIKLACEAARAGFGHDLCELLSGDAEGLVAWRERLRHELAMNESGYFRTKHKALKIPEDFPDLTVLGYHAYPAVSSADEADELRERLAEENEVDVKGLRDFVDEEFGWKYLSGAKKFMRQLAPALLSHKLLQQSPFCRGTTDIDEQTDREEHLVASMLARRNHFSTDGIPEIKIVFIPAQVVGLDLDHETMPSEDEPGNPPEDELGSEGRDCEDEDGSRERSPVRRNLITTWDPWAPDTTWIQENIVHVGAPLSLERWDTLMQSGQIVKGKNRANGVTGPGGMKSGSLNSYLRVTKPNPLTMSQQKELSRIAVGIHNDKALDSNYQTTQPPPQVDYSKQRQIQHPGSNGPTGRKLPIKRSDVKGRPTKKGQSIATPQHTNPWTLSQRKNAQAVTNSKGGQANDFTAATSGTPLTPSVDGKHLSTIIRKSLEGTWKGSGEMMIDNVTPERVVSDVSLIDMTADQ